jgi:ABC-2 type transport system permease protein
MTALVLHGARYDLKGLLRNPRARFFTLAFPILLLVVLGGVAGSSTVVQGGRHIALTRFYVPGIIAMSLILACFGSLVQAIVNRRAAGVWKRRRAAAVPAPALVAGQSLANAVLAMGSVVVLLVIGRAAFGVGIGAGPLVAVFLTAALAALCLCALAFAVASFIDSPDGSQPVVQLVTFPLFFVSGIWFPMDGLPHGLRVAADVFPVAHISESLHQAFAATSFSGAVDWGNLAVIVAWAIGAGVLAARRFEWLPARA